MRALVSPQLPPNVAFEVVVSEDAQVRGSSHSLHQVMLNLVKNAVEAIGDQRGHVRASIRRLGENAVIEVTDDGPGMAPDVQQRLFTPFFTTKHDGTGLGLSAAMAIVSGHRGTIRIDSEVGRGSRFSVELPLAHARPAMELRAAPGRHDLNA